MLVVNLMGEPGAGKSVASAGLFYELSIRGIKSEIIQEVAKGFAWETPKDSLGVSLKHPIFEQQVYILGEQNRLLQRVIGKRQVAIMESPLILTSIYRPSEYLKSFDNLVLEQFNCYNNFNVLLKRNHKFDDDGRVHTENESARVREKLKTYLDKNQIKYSEITTHENISKELADIIIEKFKNHLLI